MTIGDLRKAITHLDDELVIVVHVPIEDADGDTVEQFFAMRTVNRDMDPDTAEWYARIRCAPVDE